MASTPLVYFCVLYMAYTYLNSESLNGFENFADAYQIITEKFYKFVFLSKICNIWTQDLVHLCLIPIWAALWLIAVAQ